jgi:hypothetical protein
VLCRVLVPAQYSLVKRRVLVAPESERTVAGPPRRVLCYVKVLVKPAHRIAHKIPAVYKTVTVQTLVKAAGCERIVTPRPPRLVKRRVRIAPPQRTWRRMDCRPAAPGA